MTYEDKQAHFLWVDKDSGTYGANADNIMVINTAEWSDEDWETFDQASDNDRIAYAIYVQDMSGTIQDSNPHYIMDTPNTWIWEHQ